MNRTHMFLAAAIGALAAGCRDLPADDATGGGDGNGNGEETGEVQFQLTVAPTGAQCIRVVATPATGAAVTKTFPVTTGAATSAFSMGVLPTGAIAFSGDAFTAACSAIGSATAGWTADPASATIRTGVVTNVMLTFRPRNPVGVSINFVRNIAAVIASGSTSAALTDGPPLIWGQATGNWITPTVFSPPTDAVGFAAGFLHACIVRKDGSVWCWGQSNRGQVGPGIAIGSGILDAVQVPLPGPATLVSAGGLHSCAYVTSPRSVYCWGANDNGQTGNGTTPQSATPVAVPNTDFPVIRALSAGTLHNIATTADGHYLAWGMNSEGQLGDGTTTSRASAAYIASDNTVQGGAGGDGHSCSLHADGSVWCWGRNNFGQLGDGTTTPHNLAGRVIGLPAPATQVSLGQDHTCARLADGRVACWGRNYEGELGDLSAVSRAVPILVNLGGETAQTVTSGFLYNCVFTTSLTSMCWGYNGFGQIGDGTNNNAYGPVKITLQ